MSSQNWPSPLPFSTNPLTDGPTTRDATYFQTNAFKPLSDGLVALLGSGETPFTPTGGWVYDSSFGFYTPAYQAFGIAVTLRGRIKNGGTGTANPIFTFPAALAPSAQLNFLAPANNSMAAMILDTAGRLYVSAYQTGGSNASLLLDGISWDAD